MGVENLNVFRHVGRICDKVNPFKTFILMDDGGFLALIYELVRKRGKGTTRVTEVKGHATEGMVRFGQVREDNRCGNEMADKSAELGRRRRVDLVVIDVTFLVFAVGGAPSCCCCYIGSSLPLPVLWSIMMDPVALRLTLSYGLLVPSPKSVGSCRLSVALQCYLYLVGGVRPNVLDSADVVAWPFFCRCAGQDCCFPWYSSLAGCGWRFGWWMCLLC